MEQSKESRPNSIERFPSSASFSGDGQQGSSLERKMEDMRHRFRMLQLMEEVEGKDDTDSPANIVHSGNSTAITSPSPQNLATARWNKLRKVIRSSSNASHREEGAFVLSPRSPRVDSDEEKPEVSKEEDDESQPTSSKPVSRPSSAILSKKEKGSSSKYSVKKLEKEDEHLMNLWKEENFFEPFPFDQIKQPETQLPPIPVSDIELKFEEDAAPLKLEISRVPEEAVQEKKDTIEKALLAQQKVNVETIKKLHTDVIWREDLARKRVTELEQSTKQRINIERTKMVKAALEREKNLGQQFRKAREELEEGIRRQEAAVKEHFGRVLVHNESLARRFFVFTKMFPQPIEFRIHLMRAVKDKLAKGAYVLMLTQYDRLGGNPLVWSEIGANGIGKMKPGITKVVRHQGRYYDRILRFEDSCFALCPPGPRIKPGYIFVLELFQLASHKNPFDKIVGWTAVPMSYESMNIIEGKFKLPILRGEHTQRIQHFREMEHLMATDLSNWLCNVYLEVRHMSLHELGATEEMLKSTDFDLDYFNKVVLSDEYLRKSAAAAAAAKEAGKPIEDRSFGSEKHKEAILKAPFTPFEVAFSPTNASEKPLFEKHFSNENSRNEDDVTLDELDRLEKQIQAKANEEKKKNLSTAAGQSEIEIVQLPVDKGIFRRKVHHSLDSAKDPDGRVSNSNNPVTSAGTTSSNNNINETGRTNLTAGKGGDESEDAAEKKKKNTVATAKLSYLDRSLIALGLKKASVETGFKSADSSQQLSLSPKDSFYEHKQKLLKKWKENVQKKFPKHQFTAEDGEDDDQQQEELMEVRERGYYLQDEAFLHKHQRGKLMGLETIDKKSNRQWAQATLEGKVVRKWQADGPRFDSEAIKREGGNSPRGAALSSPTKAAYYSPHSGQRKFFAKNEAGAMEENLAHLEEKGGEDEEDTKWEELKDPREMVDYQMSIAVDPTSRKNLIPGAISATKLRYLTQELFGDLLPTSFGTFDFYMTILLYLFTFWMRIYVHYLAQYLFLLAQNTPVYSFGLNVLYIMFKYSSSSISLSAEVGTVAIGPIANICVFLFMASFGMAFYKFSGFLPDGFSKLFAYYGVATILDPLLTVIVDLIYHHYDCSAVSSACVSDYTSSSCDCYNGDFVKLWYRIEQSEGTGLTGLFITLLIYLGTGVMSCLILHEYLLHIHRDGRILDLWRRVNAPNEEFFLPEDYELSADDLMKIIQSARAFKGLLSGMMIKRHVVIQDGVEKDPNDPNFLGSYRRVLIYQQESTTGKQFIYRHFFMDHWGKIIEVFNDSNVKATDFAPKRAFQGLLTNKETLAAGGGGEGAAAATAGTVAVPSIDLSKVQGEEAEEKKNEEGGGGDPPLPSDRKAPGSLPPSARSARSLPPPTQPLPKGLLPPSQLTTPGGSPRLSPRAAAVNQLLQGDKDDEEEAELLPQEEDYEHQEELLREKRRLLHHRGAKGNNKSSNNQKRDEDAAYYHDEDHEEGGEGEAQDKEEEEDELDGDALLANQPRNPKRKTKKKTGKK